MDIIKKLTNSKCWRGCGEMWTPPPCRWEHKSVQPLRTTVRRFLKKLTIEWPYDPTIPFPGMYWEKTTNQKDTPECSLQHYLQWPRCGSNLGIQSLSFLIINHQLENWRSHQCLSGKEHACHWRRWGVPSLGQKDSLEEGTAAHSSILAWEIPWTEENGRLQSMGSQRVGHDLATK